MRAFLISSLALVCLSACQHLPFTQPATELAESSAVVIEKGWWMDFHDPLLNELVPRVQQQNLDIQIAQARIAEARGMERIAESGLWPSINLGGSATRGNTNFGITQPVSILKGGFESQWELDVFGGNRAAQDAAELQVTQATALQDATRQRIIAELARAVMQYRLASQQLEHTTALATTTREMLTLNRARSRAGLDDARETARNDATLAQIHSRIAPLEAAQRAALYQIDVLLGQEAGTLESSLSHASFTPHIPDVPTLTGLSLSSLKERPDMRAAQAALLTTQAQLRQAEANLWPKLSIGQFFGVQEGSDGVRMADNPIWSISANLSAPLLNFGALRGAVDAASARSSTAVLQYEQTSLNALLETRTALVDVMAAHHAFAELHATQSARAEDAQLAAARYKAGLSDARTMLEARARHQEAALETLAQQTLTQLSIIRLYKALEKGFSRGLAGNGY